MLRRGRVARVYQIHVEKGDVLVLRLVDLVLRVCKEYGYTNQEEYSRFFSVSIGHLATLAPEATRGRQIQITQPSNHHYDPYCRSFWVVCGLLT